MPTVECRELKRSFGPARALAGVTLAAESGEWVTIVGPSGSGKTTLLRAVAGLEPLDSGEIRLDGQLATNSRVILPPHRRGLAYLPQGESLWPHLAGLENVALGLCGAARERKDRARQWLERLGVGHAARRLPSELSGGEARRVALARALAGGARLLLMDEPTAHLDLHLREGLVSELRRLHRELGLTTLCVTHQVEPPIQQGDRVVIIEEGAVRLDGAVEALVTAPVPSPFMQSLTRSIQRFL